MLREIHTSAASFASPSRWTGTNIGAHTSSSVHTHGVTDTCNRGAGANYKGQRIKTAALLKRLLDAAGVLKLPYFSHIFYQCSHPSRCKHYSAYSGHHSYREGCRQLRDKEMWKRYTGSCIAKYGNIPIFASFLQQLSQLEEEGYYSPTSTYILFMHDYW